MRLVAVLVPLVLVWVSPLLLGMTRMPDGGRSLPPSQTLFQDVKIVCGDTAEGYRCRREPGAVRRGKTPKIPKSRASEPSSGSSGWSLWGSDDDEAGAPPPAPAAGTSSGPTASGGCPPNSERLGGHCIPYTQTCRSGLAANAPPQSCATAQEKLVCSFRPDGLKDCCCRIYSQ